MTGCGVSIKVITAVAASFSNPLVQVHVIESLSKVPLIKYTLRERPKNVHNRIVIPHKKQDIFIHKDAELLQDHLWCLE